MMIVLVKPSDRPDPYNGEEEAGFPTGHHTEYSAAVDCSLISSTPLVVFSVTGQAITDCVIQESDDALSWTTMAGIAFATSDGVGTQSQFDYGVRTKRYVRAKMDFDFNDSADRFGFNVIIGDLDPESFSPEPPFAYLGRFQQGKEVELSLQCTDNEGSPDDPLYTPTATILRDDGTPEAIEVIDLPADQRGVELGRFRHPLFLGSMYSSTGRYLVLFKWIDSDSVARSSLAAFHILPGGSGDGSIISMFHSGRPNASYLIYQCDSGRIVRKPNPR